MADIEKFNPATLMDGVRDRIKATFVSLIPEEQWEKLVQSEVDRFFNTNKDVYNNRSDRYTDFQLIVRQELEKATRERLTELLRSPEYLSTYSPDTGVQTSEFIAKFLTDNAQKVFANMLTQTFQLCLQSAQFNVVKNVNSY